MDDIFYAGFTKEVAQFIPAMCKYFRYTYQSANNRKDGQNTFKKIQREIEGISAKMLSKELHDLEINLLVSRTVLDTRPITVKYAITEYGSSVLPVTESLVIWGLNHREKIKA